MQEYLVMLLIILLLMSLVLVANHSFFKSRIHLRTTTVFATIGVTLLLGAFFPWVLSTLALSAALLIYLGVIILSAFALSYCDVKIPARDPINPVITKEPENEIEEPGLITSTAFEFNEKTAFIEACATLDCTAPAAAENNIKKLLPETQRPSYVEARQSIPADEPPTTILEADPALDETKSLTFASDVEFIKTSMVDGLLVDAEAAYKSEFSGELAKDRTAGGNSKPAVKPGLPLETVNDNISAGFAAKASGDMASALVSFMNAFSLNQEPDTAVALAVEISNVYQELGHYPQAELVIKSLLEQEYFNITPVRQQLENHLLYLETFTELLKVAGMPPNAPYSKVPNLVKTKANIDTVEIQKKNNQGGI